MPRRRGRGRKRAQADTAERRHPNLVPAERLLGALNDLTPGADSGEPPMPLLFELRLPTRSGRPIFSPSLRPLVEREDQAPPVLERWQIEGLLFPTVRALSVLAGVPT